MENNTANFEAGIRRLEEIVRQLERGDAALDDSLKLFREGTELVRTCTAMLDRAEQEVLLVTKGADGAPVISEFSDDAE